MWLQVNIVVLVAVCVPFITSAVPNYQTSTKQNWTTAQEGCTLIGQSVFCDANGICNATTNEIQGNGSVIDAWVGAYYKKSPWITHLGCYSSTTVKLTDAVKIKGNSVKNCYTRCKYEMKNQLQVHVFALQEGYCFCTFDDRHTANDKICRNTCGNTEDYCGSNVQKNIVTSVYVSLYSVGSEDDKVLYNKECRKIQNSVVVAEDCTALHGVICLNGESSSYTVMNESVTWKDARRLCRSEDLDTGRLIYESEFNETDGNFTKSYWIDEFRFDILQWINDSSELSVTPRECVGLSVTGNTANFTREDCTKKKAALCFGQGEQQDDILTSLDYTIATGISDIVSITTEPIIRWTSEKTDAELTTESSTMTTRLEFTPPLSQEDNASDSNQVFVYVGAGVAFIVVVCIVATVLIMRKRKSSKKSLRGNDDANVEDAGVMEGQALLLNDSPTNNQNSAEGNTDAYSVVVSTKGFDHNNKETEIGDYNEKDTEKNEYHHLRFKGSKRYSVDENDDDTYDHTTALLEDELYSKTSTACKAKDESPDPTYDHALQRDSTYDHCVPRSEKGTESYPNNQEVDYPYDKCQNVVRQDNTGPADDPCQPTGNMDDAVQSDADPCQLAGNVHDALQSDDDPRQPAVNMDDAVKSDADRRQLVGNVHDALQSDDDPRQPAGDVDDAVQSDKPSQPDTIPVEGVIPTTDGI